MTYGFNDTFNFTSDTFNSLSEVQDYLMVEFPELSEDGVEEVMENEVYEE